MREILGGAGAAGMITLVVLLGCETSVRQVSRGEGEGAASLPPFFVRSIAPSDALVEIGPRFVIRVTFSRGLGALGVSPVVVIDLATGVALSGATSVEAGAAGSEQVLQWRPDPGALQTNRSFEVSLSPEIHSDDGVPISLDPDPAVVGPESVRFPLEYEAFRIAPELVGVVEAIATSCSSIRLDWSAAEVRDNSSAVEIRYRVFVVAGPDLPTEEDFHAETAPGETSFFVADLDAATEYRASIVAVDAVGNESAPIAAPATATSPVDRCDPLPPMFAGLEELVVALDAPDALTARWSPASDNETLAADIRYRVYVALAPGTQDFDAPLLTSAPGVTEVSVTPLIPDNEYSVVIRAIDASGNEDSNAVELSALTPVSFRLTVRPILDEPLPAGGGCTAQFCHSTQTRSGGLDLMSYASALAGGRTVAPPAINPGSSLESLILWRTDASNPNFIRDRSRMPLGSPTPLTEFQLGALSRWIDQGAVDN